MNFCCNRQSSGSDRDHCLSFLGELPEPALPKLSALIRAPAQEGFRSGFFLSLQLRAGESR